jgi:hypothetical protein
MKLKITKEVAGYPQFKVGDIVEDAELLMGANLVRSLVEENHAELVGASKTEKAVIKPGETPEK